MQSRTASKPCTAQYRRPSRNCFQYGFRLVSAHPSEYRAESCRHKIVNTAFYFLSNPLSKTYQGFAFAVTFLKRPEYEEAMQSRSAYPIRKIGKGQPHRLKVDDKKSVVAFGVKDLFSGNDLTTEQPAQPTGIQVSPFERLIPEMLNKGSQKGSIGPPVGGFTVPKPLAPGKSRGTFRVCPSNCELKIGAGQSAGKPAMLQHVRTSETIVSQHCAAC